MKGTQVEAVNLNGKAKLPQWKEQNVDFKLEREKLWD